MHEEEGTVRYVRSGEGSSAWRPALPVLAAVIAAVVLGGCEPERDAPEGFEVGQVFSVPAFGDVPTLLTDLCYQPGKRSFRVCSDGGDGELPLRSGEVLTKPPAFMARTGAFRIRGYAVTERGLAAVDDRGRFVFHGRDRLPLPAELGEVRGLAHDGSAFWLADGEHGQLVELAVEGRSLAVRSRIDCAGGGELHGVAWDGARLWSLVGRTLRMHGGDGEVARSFELPRAASGIAFAEGKLFATGLERAEIIAFDEITKK